MAKGWRHLGRVCGGGAVTNQLFAEIRIEVWRGSSETRQKIYEVQLGNAHITGIVTSAEQTFAESVTIRAASLNLSFFTQNPDGSAGSTVTTSVDCD